MPVFTGGIPSTLSGYVDRVLYARSISSLPYSMLRMPKTLPSYALFRRFYLSHLHEGGDTSHIISGISETARHYGGASASADPVRRALWRLNVKRCIKSTVRSRPTGQRHTGR